MSYQTYKLIHVIAVVVLFLGLGGMLACMRPDQRAPRIFPVLHGLGLLGLVVAGFGAAARLEIGFPNWLIAKIGVWLLIGALPPMVRRGFVPAPLAWLMAAGLGGAAVWLAQIKPF